MKKYLVPFSVLLFSSVALGAEIQTAVEQAVQSGIFSVDDFNYYWENRNIYDDFDVAIIRFIGYSVTGAFLYAYSLRTIACNRFLGWTFGLFGFVLIAIGGISLISNLNKMHEIESENKNVPLVYSAVLKDFKIPNAKSRLKKLAVEWASAGNTEATIKSAPQEH